MRIFFKLKTVFSTFVLLTFITKLLAIQNKPDYTPLDPENPIIFNGESICFNEKTYQLGPTAFFIDGQLSNETANQYSYVFNSLNEAVKHLSDGDEQSPMTLYIAPYVYWIDNPDNPGIRVAKAGQHSPFGLEIECEWLRFFGLTNNPEKVILASNRGQTMGAKGNFTMLNIIGNGISSENITFANYCNIDLNFPLKPELNRKKRGSAIVQAQLIFVNGDKIFARNTHFISRLNLCPFVGGKRTLFDRCHFEMTDDALAPKGVYLNSTFEFYSSKPFYHTSGTGAIFLNCDFKSFTRGNQYFSKSTGQIAVIDTRLEGEHTQYWGWRDKPSLETKYYQFNNYYNKKPVFIGKKHEYASIDMTGKQILDAYRIEFNNEIIYNTYNLLRGNDEWDPMNIKKYIKSAEAEHAKKYTDLATQLLIEPSRKTLETGKDQILLHANTYKFGDFKTNTEKLVWAVNPGQENIVRIEPNKDGSCLVVPTNRNDETEMVIITAKSTSGLEASSVLYIAPEFLEAPRFINEPGITIKNGSLTVNYELDMRFDDHSLISWYRCTDATGANPIQVSVSSFNKPMYRYPLNHGDIGYYLMASIEPKHIRCHPGKAFNVVFKRAITSSDVLSVKNILPVNIENLSTKYQPRVIPGFWSIDSYAPDDTKEYNWEANNNDNAWYYGSGINGAANDTGLVQAIKGARLRFTPTKTHTGNMKLSFTACPSKTAGQGFSSARAQYMDIGIHFDTKNLTGYALRLIRTTKYGDAIDCYFVKYTNGKTEQISQAFSTSCFRTPCFIRIETEGNLIKAHAHTTSNYYQNPNHKDVLTELNIETEIKHTGFSGILIQHTGSVGSGATLIKDLKIEWN